VLEGHARLTAFMLARGRLPPELEVLAGSSPAMTSWGFGSRSVARTGTVDDAVEVQPAAVGGLRAVDVQLQLAGRAVADAHPPRAAPALEMVQGSGGAWRTHPRGVMSRIAGGGRLVAGP
jgi:hypothetical protein